METTWSPEGRAARWPPPEPLFVFVFTVVLWGATARVAIHGERLISSAVAVSSARINIKGMLGETHKQPATFPRFHASSDLSEAVSLFAGRTSWCKYFMSLPIGIQLKSGVNVHAENLALGVGVCVIFLLYLGLDPTMCSAGWFTCEGVQPRGSFETYQATGMGLVGEQGDGEG